MQKHITLVIKSHGIHWAISTYAANRRATVVMASNCVWRGTKKIKANIFRRDVTVAWYSDKVLEVVQLHPPGLWL